MVKKEIVAGSKWRGRCGKLRLVTGITCDWRMRITTEIEGYVQQPCCWSESDFRHYLTWVSDPTAPEARPEAKSRRVVHVGDVYKTNFGVEYTVIDATPGAYRMALPSGEETGDGSYSEQDFHETFSFWSGAVPARQLHTTPVNYTWGESVAKPAVSMQHNRDVARVQSAIDAIGPNALGLLADVAERLVKGKANGDFDGGLRDWTQEAYEEDLDALVYRTMAVRQRVGE